MTSLGFSSTSDVITFDQNWHHLCSTSAGGEDLSSNAQIGVIGRMRVPRYAQKCSKTVERKTQTKICCHYTWLLHGKICPSRWRFLRSFLIASKPSRRSITAAKTKEKEKKERRRKNLILISAHARVKMSQNAMPNNDTQRKRQLLIVWKEKLYFFSVTLDELTIVILVMSSIR